MVRIQGFTIVPYSQVGYANALAESFCRHHPGKKFVVAVLDRPTLDLPTPHPNVEFLTVPGLGHIAPNFLELATALGDVHLVAHLAPRLAEKLAETSDVLFYFHHKAYVYGHFERAINELSGHEILAVPRRLTPPPIDGRFPNSHFFHHTGMFNTGVLGINCHRRGFLDWWKKETALAGNLEFPTDFRFVETALTFFDAGVLRDEGYGVSYWNRDERDLQLENGWWNVGSSRLTLALFPGFNVREPFWPTDFGEGKPRLRLSEDHIARQMYTEYATVVSLQAPSSAQPAAPGSDDLPYGWRDIFPGVELTAGLMHVFRTEWIRSQRNGNHPPPSPFRANNLIDFKSWLEDESTEPGPRLQRFVLATLIDRPDIREAFVHGRNVDYEGLRRWIIAHGRVEQPVTMFCRFNPPSHDEIEDQGRSGAGVDVIGSLASEHGLGEAGRLLVEALRATSLQVSTIAFSPVGIRGKHPFVADNVSRNRITAIALNPEQIRDLWTEYGESLRRGRYVIGQWFWELETPPPWYQRAFRDGIVQELWAPTRFIEEMLRSCAPQFVEVRHMPLPLLEPKYDAELSLKSFGLDSKFSFLFTFDFGSVMKRKNPEGTIQAYKKAFRPSDGAQLIIKSINGRNRPKEFEHLQWMAENREDIILIDEYFDNDRNAALMRLTDCYVSLHRSEGLGLTLAEAMLLEKPVIATGYSGNLDFMDESTAMLVPWKYTKVGQGADAYPRNAQWAEPDLNAATEMMRWVFLNRSQAQEMGKAAREKILTEFSPQVCGKKMQRRIEELR